MCRLFLRTNSVWTATATQICQVSMAAGFPASNQHPLPPSANTYSLDNASSPFFMPGRANAISQWAVEQCANSQSVTQWLAGK